MKYIKIQDTVVVFDELTNHGFMARLLSEHGEVQTAGFVKLFPTADNTIRHSVSGRSSTLKIDSNPSIDKVIVQEHFNMSPDSPVNFIAYEDTLILFPMNCAFDIVAEMKAIWPGADFVHGQVSFTTVETDDFRFESGYRAIPAFSNLVGTVTEATKFTFDFNIRAN
jgi:hypothetical protein